MTVVDAKAVIFTLDVEDHSGIYAPNGRYVGNTLRLIERLAEKRVRGTFFFVGRAAEAAPQLVRAALAAGQEVGCHSWAHRTLNRETPESFRAGTSKAKALLEDISGRPVMGYRAPIFSLVAATTWATDILSELGFCYSSSVLPAINPLYGFPGAPQTPFRWPSGLVELPCPIGLLGPFNLPYLGGFYLRGLPLALSRQLLRRERNPCCWTYCHPYDFDAGEPFIRMPDTGLVTNLLLWTRRTGAFDKLMALIADCPPSGPLIEWLQTAPTLHMFNQL